MTLDAGRDEFGSGSYGWARSCASTAAIRAGSVRPPNRILASRMPAKQNRRRAASSERFVDLGVSGGRLGLDLGGFSAANESAPVRSIQSVLSPHLGIGLRGAVSAHNDVGVRAEFDDFKGLMVGLRVIDYRYRLTSIWRLEPFSALRATRAPPGAGVVYGRGLQWLNIWHQWDLSLEDRYFNALQRDKVLPSDRAVLQATGNDPVEWYTMQAPRLYLSRRF